MEDRFDIDETEGLITDISNLPNAPIMRLFLMLTAPNPQDEQLVVNMHRATADMIRACPVIPQAYSDQLKKVLKSNKPAQERWENLYSILMASFTTGFLLATLLNMSAKNNKSKIVPQ